MPPRSLVELADRIGLLLYVESNASWELRDSPQVRQRFEKHIRSMIVRDRNHPSIVMWGLLNETHAEEQVAAVAVESLSLVRHLDPTRIVLLNSGRYDFDLRVGTLSNPGSTTWQHLIGAEDPDASAPPTVASKNGRDVQAERRLHHVLKARNKQLTGDLHHYADFPLQEEERIFYRTVGTGMKPIFFSEFGRGSAIDVASLYDFYARNKATHLEPARLVQHGLELFKSHWLQCGLDELVGSPSEFFEWSMLRSAADRKELINAIRSNPQVIGFNNVSLSERPMLGQGLLTLDGNIKPGMMEAMQDALAPLRFCLFTHPTNVYSGTSTNLEVVLANADALPPGNHPIVVTLRDGANKVVFEREAAVNVPPGEAPLAQSVLKETVVISGQEGRYELTARFRDGRVAPGGSTALHVFDAKKMPPVQNEVTLWGDDGRLRSWLTANGIRCREFAAGQMRSRELILVSHKTPAPGGREVFEELARRIARGSAAIFLSEQVFADGKFTTRWLPLETKGIITRSRSWLYGRDEWVKNHPVFEGLQRGGLMDLQFYRELLEGAHPVFTDTAKPGTAIAGCFQTSSIDKKLGLFHHGLLVAEFPFGSGRFLLNTLRIGENLGKVPQAERLLRNMLNHMARNLDQPVTNLPVGFEERVRGIYGSHEAAKPQIAIMAPVDDSVVKAPGTMAITVWTAEPELAVTRVEFYSNGAKIGEDVSRNADILFPFEFIWPHVPPGDYRIFAKAIHDGGATESTPVTVRVE